MSATKPRTVATPGEPTPANPPEETSGAGSSEGSGTTAEEGESDTVNQLMAMVKAQAGQIEALTSAVQNVARATSPVRAQAEELPHIDDINKAATKSPVLTKQGWYVPADYGSNPHAPKG